MEKISGVIVVRKLATQNIKTETDEVRLDGVLDEFRTALQEEIQAARVFESSNAVQLKNGRRIAKIGKNFQYLFEIENALNLPGDTPGDLLIPDNPPINVMIVSIEGLAITVSIPENIGNFVPMARLKSNLTYLLIRLIERIESYANKSNPVGDRIIGAHPISGSEPAIELPESYNDHQKSAIASSVGRDTTFIWGPPGTGKTQTIGEIGFQLYKRKRSILLVSHTNTAVDQAIIKIGKKIHQDDLKSGKAIRVGEPKDERLREESNLLLEMHVAKRSEELANKRDELKSELEKGSSESFELSRLINLCEWVKSSKASIHIMADNLQEIQKVENEIIVLKSQISQAIKNRAFWQEATTEAKQINEIIRESKKNDNNLRDIKNQIYELEKSLDHRANEISEEKKILSEAKSFGWLTRRWKGLPQPEDQEEKIRRLEREYSEQGIELDHKRNDLFAMQLERGRRIQAINRFQKKFGGLPEDAQRKGSENESLIKELTQKFQKKKKSANPSLRKNTEK